MSPDQANEGNDVEPKSEMMLEDDSDDDEEDTLKPSNSSKNDKTRRISHSEIERRRREKMNRFIDEIAQLLPIDPVKKLDKLTVLRVAVDTVKHLKAGASSKSSAFGFGKQPYLDDNELLELTLAAISEMDRYFFLLIECSKGRICYASNSVESVLGSKPTDLCSQTIFDILSPIDVDVVRQQLISEKKSSSTDTDESPSDSKNIPILPTRQTCLEIGNRRAFSCRILSRKKRSNRASTTTTTNNYLTVDFVGYIKPYSLVNDDPNDVQYRAECRPAHIKTLTPSDVWNAIGTNPTSCLLTMGKIVKPLERRSHSPDNNNPIDRMFLYKLNADGQFTYFDHISYPLLGYLSQDLLGSNFKDFIHEDDRNRMSDLWNRICRDRQIVTSDNYRFRTSDNIYIVVQTIFEPFVNPWNDELEIIVARNKAKMKSHRISSSTSSRSTTDPNTPSTVDSAEILRQLLP